MTDGPDELPAEWAPEVCDSPTDLVPLVESGVSRYRDVQFGVLFGFRPLLLDLTVPRKGAPIVVIIHGGAWMAGSHKPRPGDAVPFVELQDELLRAGLAVAFIQYRLSGEARFPAQLHDVRAAIRWLRYAAPHLGLDGERIGVMGDSAGGHLALLAGTNVVGDDLAGDVGMTGESSDVQAAVGWYPPTQLDTMAEQSAAGSLIDHDAPDSPESLLIGEGVESNRGLARWASPFAHASATSAPTLLIHGDSDAIVPFPQSVVYAERLTELGVPVQLMLVPGADHGFIGADTAPLVSATVEFLTDQLRA